jgi:hypothetical protein
VDAYEDSLKGIYDRVLPEGSRQLGRTAGVEAMAEEETRFAGGQKVGQFGRIDANGVGIG